MAAGEAPMANEKGLIMHDYGRLTDGSVGVSDERFLKGRLTVSLVTYHPDGKQLAETLGAFAAACKKLTNWQVCLFLIDNTSPVEAPLWLTTMASEAGAVLITGHGNVGFGRGHNIVLDRVGDYHLILNPDVSMAHDALAAALAFMTIHTECGLLTPAVFWADGVRQYLCKRMPTLWDLLLRGFAPKVVKRIFADRLANYEMRDQIGDEVVWDPPIVSGCFMLFRGEVLRRLEGFDPRFFLYFEDFDLSLRAAKLSRVAYVPLVRIVHHGGHAARKGWSHVRMFGRSAITFFTIHGWKIW